MINVKMALLILLIICPKQYLIAQSSIPKLNKPTQKADTASHQQSQAPSTAQPEEDSADEVLHIETTLITVPVSVLDRTGRFMADLQQGDFRIYENGVEQPIAYFASVEQPFTVVLLLDISGSTAVHLKNIQEAAITFIDKLRPHDNVIVAAFDDRVQVLKKAINDRDALREAIRRTQPGGGTRLYDMVDVLFKRVMKRIPGRKAIILFTDGWDTSSSATFKSNIRDVEETDVLIYPIMYPIMYDARQSFDDKSDYFGKTTSIEWNGTNVKLGENYLSKLASKTGGRFYRVEKIKDISQSFASIAEELRRQYSLGYYLKALVKSGERRRIKVRVNRKNVAVKAREGYVYNQSSHKAK